jgi:RNA polymerase sigma factor (sigma-70 family)
MTRLSRRLGGTEWEDVLQDALAQAWRRRETYDADRGTERTWLLTIVADQARKTWRRRRPDPTPLDDSAVGPAEPNSVDIERAIAALPERQRLAITLFYFLDLPIADAAVVMDCAPGTVKSTLAEARRRLRNHLGSDYE